MERISRRNFIKMLVIGGPAVGLAACSETTASPTPLPTPARIGPAIPASVITATAVTNNADSLRNKLLGTIDNHLLEEVIQQLPTSLYRQYIEGLGLTFFKENTPSHVAFAGITMPLYPARVKTERVGTIVHGEATLRKFQEQKALTTSQAQTISFPVPFILEGNGLLKTEVTLTDNVAIVTGLSPRILIRYPQDENIDAKLKPILPDILMPTIIKEVATIGVMANYLQFMASMISTDNSQYKVQTKEAGEVEILSHVYANLTHQIGRLTALLDWAPFILMVKAVSSQKQMVKAMRSFTSMTQPIDAILASDFGTKLEDLLPNSFAWCIRNRKLMESITHTGNFDVISPS